MGLAERATSLPVSHVLICRHKPSHKQRDCVQTWKSAASCSAQIRLQKHLLKRAALPFSPAQISESDKTADQNRSHANATRSTEVRERIDSGSHASTSAPLAEEVEINLVSISGSECHVSH